VLSKFDLGIPNEILQALLEESGIHLDNTTVLLLVLVEHLVVPVYDLCQLLSNWRNSLIFSQELLLIVVVLELKNLTHAFPVLSLLLNHVEVILQLGNYPVSQRVVSEALIHNRVELRPTIRNQAGNEGKQIVVSNHTLYFILLIVKDHLHLV